MKKIPFGRQRAAVTSGSKEDFETPLEHSQKLLDVLEEAREEYVRAGGISLDGYLLRKAKQSH